MLMSGEFPEKMDALDLILNALKDHEKQLDELSHKLQMVFRTMTPDRLKGKETKTQEQSQEKRRSQTHTIKPLIHCTNWSEFKAQVTSHRASIVAYHANDDIFSVKAITEDFLLEYTEPLPNTNIRIDESTTQFSFDKTSLYDIQLLQVIINRSLQCGLAFPINPLIVFKDSYHYLCVFYYNGENSCYSLYTLLVYYATRFRTIRTIWWSCIFSTYWRVYNWIGIYIRMEILLELPFWSAIYSKPIP